MKQRKKTGVLLSAAVLWLAVGCGCAQESGPEFVVKDAEAYTLPDGAVVSAGSYEGVSRTVYRLEDGTELLAEEEIRAPNLSAQREGLEGFSEPARQNIAAFYEQQGALYDREEYLLRAYEAYCAAPSDFDCWLLDQKTALNARSEQVVYCTTRLFLPLGGRECDRYVLTRAFDWETGEVLDSEDLLSVGEAEAKRQIVSLYGGDEDMSKALEEVFRMEFIQFGEDGFEVIFPAETVKGLVEQGGTGFSGSYEDLSAVMKEWAIPTHWY